jgi:hypothetical protein
VTDTQFSSGQICTAGGFEQFELNRLVRGSRIIPDHVPEGRGLGHRRYSFMQALALLYGVWQRKHALAGWGWAEEAARFVASLDHDAMLKKFEAGFVVVWARPGGRSLLAKLVLSDEVCPAEIALGRYSSLEHAYKLLKLEAGKKPAVPVNRIKLLSKMKKRRAKGVVDLVAK